MDITEGLDFNMEDVNNCDDELQQLYIKGMILVNEYRKVYPTYELYGKHINMIFNELSGIIEQIKQHKTKK